MAYAFMFCCFTVGAAISALAARTGRRGEACDRLRGYEVPARVAADPDLKAEANRAVATWCTRAAILCLAPLVPLGIVIASGGGKTISTWGLAAFALYGMAVATVGGYPFEKIKRM